MNDYLSKLSPDTSEYIKTLRREAANYRIQLKAARAEIVQLRAQLEAGSGGYQNS